MDLFKLASNGEEWRKAFEEGQGPHWAVGPVMMMMIIQIFFYI
jgi:hypothetical protein